MDLTDLSSSSNIECRTVKFWRGCRCFSFASSAAEWRRRLFAKNRETCVSRLAVRNGSVVAGCAAAHLLP
jgi:plasmid rolling circle replication initiator protein Rep